MQDQNPIKPSGTESRREKHAILDSSSGSDCRDGWRSGRYHRDVPVRRRHFHPLRMACQYKFPDHWRLGGGFFSRLGIALVGGVALGVRLYFLIGLLFGASLGIAIAGIEPLRHLSAIKKVGVNVLFVGVMSLPLLAAGSLALKMSAVSAGLWFSISFVMHLVYGLVSGVIICYRVGNVIRKSEVHGVGNI
jgi:hypothetical protein